jgi:CHAD domain-containing protein
MNKSPTNEMRSEDATSESKDLSVIRAVKITIAPRLAEVHRCTTEVLKPGANAQEAVHDLRVSTRRATAALEFMRGVVRNKFRRETVKRLKTICRYAGRVRDLDVMIERIRTHCEGEAKPLMESIQRNREVMHTKLKASLHGIDSRWLLHPHDNLSILKRDLPKRLLDGSFKSWAHRRFTKLAKRFLQISKHTCRTPRSLHRLRIHVKELRYGLELLTPVDPEIALSSVYSRLQELQQLLGKINDSKVWCKTIKEYQGDSRDDLFSRFVKRQSRKQFQQRIAYVAQFESLWSKAERAKFRERLYCLLDTNHSS